VWSRMSLEKDLRLDRQIGDELRHLRSGSVEASETKHGALLAVRDELARAWAPWLGEACALERANATLTPLSSEPGLDAEEVAVSMLDIGERRASVGVPADLTIGGIEELGAIAACIWAKHRAAVGSGV